MLSQKNYDFDGAIYKTYSSTQIDELVAQQFYEENQNIEINIQSAIAFSGSYKVNHILTMANSSINITYDEYLSYLKKYFLKMGYNVFKVIEIINKDGSVSYQFELCSQLEDKPKGLKKVI